MENFKQNSDWQCYEQLPGKKKNKKKQNKTKCWLTLPVAAPSIQMAFAQQQYPSCQIYQRGHASTNLVGVLPE